MASLRKPNLSGPRFRKSYLTLTTVDTLQEFKAKYPEYKDLTLKDFRNVVATFNDHIVQGVIDNRNGVELPDGLGFIFMGTCLHTKKRGIDYKRSHELGVIVHHQNWDSDNKIFKIFYTNKPTKYPFQHKQAWAFQTGKPFRARASAAYRQNYARYIEVSPNKKISTMFDKHQRKEYIKNLKPIIPEGYDEFKL